MRPLIAAALAGALALASPAPVAADAQRHSYTIPHTLRFGWIEDVAGLNPHLVNNVIVTYLSDLTMAWLLRGGPDGRPGPELATAVPSKANGGISTDGKTVTYHLRKDAKWSDGAPFSAADVVFSAHAVLNPRNNEQTRYGFDVIDSIEAPDRYTVRVHLKRPYAAFIMQFFNSDGVMCLLPEHILGSLPDFNKAPYNELPIGIGPFKYAKWRRSEEVDMVANPLYFRGRPKLDRVIYKIVPDRSVVTTEVRTHELDLYPLMGPKNYLSLKGADGVSFIQTPGWTAEFLTMNWSREPFSDPVVRQAFRAALNRPIYLKTLYSNLATLAEDFYTPAYPLYSNIPLVTRDIGKANSLLEGAGWKLQPDGVRAKSGKRLEIEVVTSAGAATVDQLFELIRADVKAAGFALTVKHYPPSLIFGPEGKLRKGEFDLTAEGQPEDSLGDVSVNFACAQKPPEGYNFGRVCIPQADALFAQFNATYEEPERKVLAARYQRLLVDQVGFIGIPAAFDLYAFNSDLRNYNPSRVSPFDSMMNVDI